MDKVDKEKPVSKSLRYSIATLLWIGRLCETKKTPFDLSRLSFAVFHGKKAIRSNPTLDRYSHNSPYFLSADLPSPAGFVKPCGAHARTYNMPLQDVSVNRNRGWSLNTASSGEDYVVFSDSGRRLLEPERQPVNAPGSPGGRLQADEGFVRFLRTHSSPTRQRVTAGGRIVPIEPPSAPPPALPPAPPQFKLPTSNLIRNTIAPAAQNIG